MIGFWNRKEVYMGYSMTVCSEIRDILDENNIKYDYKAINRNSSMGVGDSRTVRANIGENGEQNYMYYIYVHNKDYDHVSGLIRQINKK